MTWGDVLRDLFEMWRLRCHIRYLKVKLAYRQARYWWRTGEWPA